MPSGVLGTAVLFAEPRCSQVHSPFCERRVDSFNDRQSLAERCISSIRVPTLHSFGDRYMCKSQIGFLSGRSCKFAYSFGVLPRFYKLSLRQPAATRPSTRRSTSAT